MRRRLKLILGIFLSLSIILSGCAGMQKDADAISETGEYTGCAEVAAYINSYHHLPDNYVTKNEAHNMGWDGGNPYEEIGFYIGGDYFGNREKKLPEDRYYECDVDYTDSSRGPRRLVYTDEGTVYYTEDHYNSFDRLY